MDSLLFSPFLPTTPLNQLLPTSAPPSSTTTSSCKDHLDAHTHTHVMSQLLPATDDPLASPSAPANSRKRRAVDDLLGDLLCDVHYGWRPLNDGASLHDATIYNNISPGSSPMQVITDTLYQPGDLEDVLNFLRMDDEAASKTTESAASSSSSSGNGLTPFAPVIHGVIEEGFKGETADKCKVEGEHTGVSWQSRKGQEAMVICQENIIHGIASWPASATISSCKDSSAAAFASRAVWAGPTLMDIESALASNPAPVASTKICSPRASSLGSPFVDIKRILAHEQASSCSPNASSLVSSFFDIKNILAEEPSVYNKELPEQDSMSSSSWRLTLQKRNNLEPKDTVKVESEDKALNDGYRWRKYGQKIIKNNPFPRSYYRCTSGKCNAKKQVEKSQEQESVFLVTYQGIHLHHRPNLLKKFHVPTRKLHEQEKQKSPLDMSSPTSSTATSSSPSNTSLLSQASILSCNQF